MKIFKMSAENPDMNLISEAIDIMIDGGIILYPTDTVYGLGANIFNNDAVENIYEIKKRDKLKSLSVLVQNMENLESIAELNSSSRKIINKCLPGPFTFILKKTNLVSSYVSSNTKVGVRIPDYKIARTLASLFPITTTSANLTGEKTLSNPQRILKQIGNDIDLVIDAGDLNNTKSSTIIDLSSSKPILIRNGFESSDFSFIKKKLEKFF